MALETSDPGLLLDAAGRSRRRRDGGVFSDLADQSRLQEILTGMCHVSHVGTMVFPVVLDQVAGELRQPGVDRRVGDDHMCVHGKDVSGRILVSNDSVEVHVRGGFTMMTFREPIRAAIEGSIDEYIA